ncbi:MAG: hypothetical protein ACRD6W_16220, partial [Nitrososphaerales archaeon]
MPHEVFDGPAGTTGHAERRVGVIGGRVKQIALATDLSNELHSLDVSEAGSKYRFVEQSAPVDPRWKVSQYPFPTS